jgi:hypothetical protein
VLLLSDICYQSSTKDNKLDFAILIFLLIPKVKSRFSVVSFKAFISLENMNVGKPEHLSSNLQILWHMQRLLN